METERNKLYAVYETDEWHSKDYRICRGVFWSRHEAIGKIAENNGISPIEWGDLTGDEFKSELIAELNTMGQTQGYSTNYSIEEITINDWVYGN